VVVSLLLATILALGWWVIQLKRDGQDGGLDASSAVQSQAAKDAGSSDSSAQSKAAVLNRELLQELRVMLEWVNETLAASGSVAQAIAMLDAVDRRLAADASARAYQDLRQAIDSDRTQLQRSRALDLRSTAALLDQMAGEVDRMPMISTPKPLVAKQPAPKANGQPASGANPSGATADSRTFWQRVADGLSQRVLDAVQIRRVENPEAVFLTAEQGAIVAERLKLRLLAARIALISRQPEIMQQDLVGAQTILKQAYDLSDPMVARQLEQIKQIQDASGRIAIPTIQRSIEAMDRLVRQSP